MLSFSDPRPPVSLSLICATASASGLFDAIRFGGCLKVGSATALVSPNHLYYIVMQTIKDHHKWRPINSCRPA